MADAERKTVGVFLRMTPYERDLIDLHARMLGMNRSEYVVQSAAFGKREFTLNPDAVPKETRHYVIHHHDNPAIGYLPQSKGGKPRKAEDNRVRSEGVSLRVSPYEKETVKRYAKAMNMTLTDYLLWCGLYGSDLRNACGSRFVAARDELRKLWIELRAQGRNLNQIAAAANRIASVAWRDDVDGGLIDQLARELLEDNRSTRAAVNDAIRRVSDAVDATDFRKDVTDNASKDSSDGDA